MSAILYYLSLPFIYAVSLLPFPLLYLLSDLLYVLVFHIFRYRRKVVANNLHNSFPEKSEQELQVITRKFYRFFCDLALETLKTLTISSKQLEKHVQMDRLSIIENFYEQKQSVILVMGHMGNWELAGARFGLEPLHTLYVIYHPLKSMHFERLFYRMRTRLGVKLYPMKRALHGIIRDRDKLTATAFIADQSPTSSSVYWATFLNQETAVFTGTEKIAKKMNYPVVYVSVKRPQRGVYYVSTVLLAEYPADTVEHEISELQTRHLEQDIIDQPELWLWTHRRWKRQRDKKDQNRDVGRQATDTGNEAIR